MRTWLLQHTSMLRLLPLCLAAVAPLGCTTVEGTDRKQFIIISESQENQLGADAYQQVLSEAKISTDREMSDIVRRVGERIAGVANRPDFEWEFNLIDSEQVNAFCLPGGKIAVYEGILPIMQNEAAMAAVMGHEVAHATSRHGAERMSQHLATAGIQKAIEVGMKDSSPQTRDAILEAFGMGSQLGVLLPYSRTHELEADYLGIFFAAKAGYDPHESVALWERMQAAGKKKPPEFLSTHPNEQRRIDALNELMSQAMDDYRAAPTQYGVGAVWGSSPTPAGQ